MKSKKILVLTTWRFKDGLIQSYCLPYLKIIHDIDPSAKIYLVTQEKQKIFESEKEAEESGKELAASNIFHCPQDYYEFGIRKILATCVQFFKLWWMVLSKKVTHIHCFCTPAGSLGYLLSILTGKELIIDSYEPHAESMVENGTWTKKSLAFRILWWLEKKQSKKAAYCIAAASGMKEYACEKYGIDISSFGVKPACVDLSMFSYNPVFRNEIRRKLGWENKLIAIYVGKFGGIYLDQEAFDFFSIAYKYWKEQFRVILLTQNLAEEIVFFCKKAGIPYDIFYCTKAPFAEVSHYLSAADFAITPVKPVPSKKYCTPIKNGEYWAMGLPVVIPNNISDDSAIISQYNAGAVLYSLTADEYLKAVEKIDKLLKEDRVLLRERIRRLAEKFRDYSIAKGEYNKIYGGEPVNA